MKSCKMQIVLILAWLNSVTLLHAAYCPLFDPDCSAGKANVIVVGVLKADSILEVTEVLKGTVRVGDRLRLDDAGGDLQYFAKSMGESGDLGMVGFLSEALPAGAYRLSSYFVGISSSGKIYTMLESVLSLTGSNFEAHPTWTKESFTADIQRRVQNKAKLDLILTQPRSGQRMEELIGFLLENTVLQRAVRTGTAWHRRGYLFCHATEKLSGPSVEEENILIKRLGLSSDTSEQALILDIMEASHASAGVFATVRPFTSAETHSVVRRSAFNALAAVDPYAAADVLSGYLDYDEHELDSVITALAACATMREPRKLNSKVVEPLLKLAVRSMEECQRNPSVPNDNRGWQVLELLQSHFHPSFLPILMEWSRSSLNTSGHAKSTIRAVLGNSLQPCKLVSFGEWWKECEAKLVSRHELGSWQGVKTWLRAFGEAPDNPARHVLMRWWDYEPSTPQEQLLKECYGSDPKPAKALLSELWQRKRLSPSTRMALVRDFITMKLVEVSSPFSGLPKWRELRIRGEKSFPFPYDARVSHNGAIGGGLGVKIGDLESWAESSLEGEGLKDFHSVGGRIGEGLKGVLELWEEDENSESRRDLWRLRWEVDEKTGTSSVKVVSP